MSQTEARTFPRVYPDNLIKWITNETGIWRHKIKQDFLSCRKGASFEHNFLLSPRSNSFKNSNVRVPGGNIHVARRRKRSACAVLNK